MWVYEVSMPARLRQALFHLPLLHSNRTFIYSSHSVRQKEALNVAPGRSTLSFLPVQHFSRISASVRYVEWISCIRSSYRNRTRFLPIVCSSWCLEIICSLRFWLIRISKKCDDVGNCQQKSEKYSSSVIIESYHIIVIDFSLMPDIYLQ